MVFLFWVRTKYSTFFTIQADIKSVVLLGIQTDFQKEMLKAFGSKAIWMDATHGVTQYKKYQLVTVLVVSDYGTGFPVAWFIVSEETENVLTLCLQALRDR